MNFEVKCKQTPTLLENLFDLNKYIVQSVRVHWTCVTVSEICDKNSVESFPDLFFLFIFELQQK